MVIDTRSVAPVCPGADFLHTEELVLLVIGGRGTPSGMGLEAPSVHARHGEDVHQPPRQRLARHGGVR